MPEITRFTMTKKLIFFIAILNIFFLIASLANTYTDGFNLRQAQTAILARNIFYDGFNIFPTRLTFFAPLKGNIIFEFPLIHFFTALTYKISVSEINGRLLNLFLYLLNGIILYKIKTLIFKKNISLILTTLFISSPIILYLAHAYMPETSVITFYLLSYYFFIKNKVKYNFKNEAYLHISLAFSALLKPLGGIIFIPIFLDSLYTKDSKLIIKKTLLLFLSALPFLLWMIYAQIINSSEFNVSSTNSEWSWFNILFGYSIIKYWIDFIFYKNIIFNFLFLILNPLTFVMLIFSIIRNFKSKNYLTNFHINWIITNIFVLFLLPYAFKGHPYYFIYFIPPLLYFVGLGFSDFKNYIITKNKAINYSLILNLLLSISVFSYGANDKLRISNIDEFKSVVSNNITINKKSPSEYILYSHEGLASTAVYNYYADGYSKQFKIGEDDISTLKKEIDLGAKYIFFINTNYGKTLNKLKNKKDIYNWLNTKNNKLYESESMILYKLNS
tara:strand:- start:1392 stop:2897 length:1506 start_codon:yes stop_codon:yes gene_type:complete